MKFTFLGFHAVVLVETFPLMYQLLMYGRTDINEAMVISFLGVRTDRVLESSYGNMSAHKKFQFKAQN